MKSEFLLGLALIFGGFSLNAAAASQKVSVNHSSSIIEGNAFVNGTGVMAINEVAGVGNAQANSVQMVIGTIRPVSNNILSQSVTNIDSSKKDPSSTPKILNSVKISSTAFKGAEGIAQINQVSGSGNTSANSFALGIAPGVIH
ncbi:hypothetical protein HF669_04690 [Acidithiobacillus thiooxidans]|uniref:Adhesin n=1 Tax=Acidithiobacillus thiooxidans TaxID=930 RepID=A0A1C2IIQ7_ACITH|nr:MULTISPECIES: hypothetical protein [Acidithiobacillus]MBU2810682.1 hypothetical protein [Acidithiobacillus thiooxidans]MBU2843061.1 hypothetical protein [Acidithiobacillus thiooxidans]OCX75894.1 hypothetical protein A6M23_01280 [Acidithiobacillus thiooxidans]OCX76335.1 hypothetical protein A6P07_02600 [Acidithiobacillus thiooxidans]OCX78026.1 hypothetical protein A6O24_05535 [Acidithiobacillus thiooxidans]